MINLEIVIYIQNCYPIPLSNVKNFHSHSPISLFDKLMSVQFLQLFSPIFQHVSDVSTISHKSMTNMMPKRISPSPTSVPDVSETIPLACPSPPFACLVVGRRPSVSSLGPEEAAEHVSTSTGSLTVVLDLHIIH